MSSSVDLEDDEKMLTTAINLYKELIENMLAETLDLKNQIEEL